MYEKKKKHFDALCFFCLNTKLTKETKKVLCFAKSAVTAGISFVIDLY